MDKKGFKKQLAEIDKLIKGFQAISLMFPLSNEYKQAVTKLHQDRAEVTSKIGANDDTHRQSKQPAT